tara:strand:+ start:1975 stop:2706 length:732 start_codon:yes stop_codon:yes gene_type:complete
MANKHMLDIALDMFAATFNKKEEWKAQVYPVWDAGMERVKDVHLHKAILNICMKKHKYPPTLGHVVEEVQDVIRELGGTGMELKEYRFCEHCVLREGIREVSAHFLILASKERRVHTCVCRCDCDGAEQKYPQMGLWSDLQSKMQHDARITLMEWHMSDSWSSVLTMEQREPHNYARMRRVQKEREREGRRNPYMEIAKTMIAGNYVPDEPDLARRKPTQTFDNPTTEHYTNNEWTDRDNCPF